MVGVIVGSKKTGINPDNVATPIAASFGDLITLAILAWISQGLYKCLGTFMKTVYYVLLSTDSMVDSESSWRDPVLHSS